MYRYGSWSLLLFYLFWELASSFGALGLLDHLLQQRLRLPLHHQPRILLRLRPGDRRDPLHEVEDALGRAAFLGEDRLDDLAGLRLREAALARKILPVLLCPGDDFLTRRADADGGFQYFQDDQLSGRYLL